MLSANPSATSPSTNDSLASGILNEAGIKELVDSDPSCIQWIHQTEFESCTATSSISIQEVSLDSFANGEISVFDHSTETYALTATTFTATSSSTSTALLNQEFDEDGDVYIEGTPPITLHEVEDGQLASQYDAFFSSDMDATDEIIGDGIVSIDKLDGTGLNEVTEEGVPSSVHGDDVRQELNEYDDGEFEGEFEEGVKEVEEVVEEKFEDAGEQDNENEELSEDELEDELNAFVLFSKLSAVAGTAVPTELDVVLGDGDAEKECVSEGGGDCVTDSLAGDEQYKKKHTDLVAEANESIPKHVLENFGIPIDDTESASINDTTSVVQEPLSITESNSSSTEQASNVQNQESNWESIYSSFRESSYTPTPPSTPTTTLPLCSHLEDNNDASSVISIPLSKDGTFNESDHPSLSKESLHKVYAALASCRQKGGKFPKRITITRERVKKGSGVGGILKKSTSHNKKTVLSTVWNPLKNMWSGFGFSSNPVVSVDRDTEMAESW
ncbi:UNVERIFIED_CONTAM: hypothetical protein HDU68_000769 [Siphonaria sp. JEL0065]|nr:hypothetical protein HDU68_000769 [Siphonaria sp. JEL0065]